MKIVCINGAPTSGKDLFCKYCAEEIDGFMEVFSSVDLVKKIATDLGWDGVKSLRNRKFLSDLKDLLTEWDDVPYKNTIANIEDWKYQLEQVDIDTEDAVAFVHVREPKEIDKFAKRNNAITLLLRRPEVEGKETSNHADSNILNYNYDFELWNDGSRWKLRTEARLFLKVIGVKVKE